MSKYNVIVKNSVRKELKKLPRNISKKIEKKIDELENTPFIIGSKKLEGSTDLYRIRVGDYRIIYQLINGELIIHVIKVAHRKEVYKFKLL